MRINDPKESASPKTRSESDSILTLILGTAEDSRPSVKLGYLGLDGSYRLFVFCKTSGGLDLTSQLAPPALPLLNQFLFLFARQETSSWRGLCIRHMIGVCMTAFIIMILGMGRVDWRGELDENRMKIRCGFISAMRTYTVTVRTAKTRLLTRFPTRPTVYELSDQ